MYLTHGSQASSVEGFGDRDGRRGARGTEDHREVSGIGDSSESLVGSQSWRHRREAATADLPGGRGAARRPQAGSGPGRSGLPAPLPGHHSTQYGLCFRTGRPRRRGRGSSESPAPLRGREANARPRHSGPAWPCWPPPRCWPWPRPRRPRPTMVTQSGGLGAMKSLAGHRTRSRQASRPIRLMFAHFGRAGTRCSLNEYFADSQAMLLKSGPVRRTVTRTCTAMQTYFCFGRLSNSFSYSEFSTSIGAMPGETSERHLASCAYAEGHRHGRARSSLWVRSGSSRCRRPCRPTTTRTFTVTATMENQRRLACRPSRARRRWSRR